MQHTCMSSVKSWRVLLEVYERRNDAALCNIGRHQVSNDLDADARPRHRGPARAYRVTQSKHYAHTY